MSIQELTPLENLKGRLASELRIFIDRNDDCDLLGASLQKALKGASRAEARTGNVTIQIHDEERKQNMSIRSRNKICLDKQLIEDLDNLGFQYKIESPV